MRCRRARRAQQRRGWDTAGPGNPNLLMPRQLRGKERKETKAEKAARRAANREAHEICARALPMAAGALVAAGLCIVLVQWFWS
eukprot:COSAG01_NODE_18643_length_1062_cov_3.807892_2_plen_84_part_00